MLSPQTDGFTCQNGVISFSSHITNELPNYCYHQNCQFYDSQSTLHQQMINTIQNVNIFGVKKEKKGGERRKRKQKTIKKNKQKRNTQNSIRTIIRKLKPIIKVRYAITLPKFYQSNDSLYLLAIFKRQSEEKRLPLFKYCLQQCFKDEFSIKPTKAKEKKLQAFLNFYLELEDEDLYQSNLRNTLYLLSRTGQIKTHPPKDEKLQPLYFESIVQKVQRRE